MGWNNRIIRKVKKDPIRKGKMQVWYDIHEVYYGKDGKPNGWTKDPIIGGFDSVHDALASLSHMLADVLRFPAVRINKNRMIDIEEKE